MPWVESASDGEWVGVELAVGIFDAAIFDPAIFDVGDTAFWATGNPATGTWIDTNSGSGIWTAQ